MTTVHAGDTTTQKKLKTDLLFGYLTASAEAWERQEHTFSSNSTLGQRLGYQRCATELRDLLEENRTSGDDEFVLALALMVCGWRNYQIDARNDVDKNYSSAIHRCAKHVTVLLHEDWTV